MSRSEDREKVELLYIIRAIDINGPPYGLLLYSIAGEPKNPEVQAWLLGSALQRSRSEVRLYCRNVCLHSAVLCRFRYLLPASQYLIDDTELQRFLRTKEVVPLHELLDLRQSQFLLPVKMPLIDLIQNLSDPQDLFRMNGNIRCRAVMTTARLVQHDARMWKTISLARGAPSQEETTHRRSLTQNQCGHFWHDVVHAVVDGQTGCDGAAWRVDVHGDGLV